MLIYRRFPLELFNKGQKPGLEEQNRLLDDQKKLITDIADVEKNKINNNATGQQTLLDKANQLLELEKQSIETRLQENITINKEKLTAIDDQIRLIKEASNLEGSGFQSLDILPI